MAGMVMLTPKTTRLYRLWAREWMTHQGEDDRVRVEPIPVLIDPLLIPVPTLPTL